MDVEARAGFDDLIATTGGKRIVLSAHDFDGLPPDLETRVRAMQATGAEVVKVAVTVTRLSDCVTLRDIAARLGDRDGLVLIGMGDHGAVTRVLPSRFRSRWSYAGLLAGVGQLTPETLLTELRFRDIGPATSLYGIVGSPVSHSVSPAMHNAAFRAAGMDAVYLPLPAADVDDFVTFARAFGVKGASITIPYKVAMFRLRRRDLGGRDANRRDQHGSDRQREMAGRQQRRERIPGAARPSQLPLTARRAAVLGAGGAARGVAIALASAARRSACTRETRSVRRRWRRSCPGRSERCRRRAGSWDLLVNCTPVGMYPHVDETPLPADALHRASSTTSSTTRPATRLLREAEAAGCRTIGGLEMLVGQARQQFEWWTGVCPSANVMRDAAMRRLEEFTT